MAAVLRRTIWGSTRQWKWCQKKRQGSPLLVEKSIPYWRCLCGTKYCNNISGERRLKMAVKWFRKSVDGGDDDALIQLGIHYYWGKGIREDPKAAVQCFRMATKARYISEGGRDDAFFFLGVAYCEGRAVRASIPTARKLFKRANIDGDHVAADRMLRQLQP